MNSSQTLKLISVNIEGSKHLTERVIPFLVREQPDVVCLQEVFEVDLDLLSQKLAMPFRRFSGMTKATTPNPHIELRGVFGLAQFSRLPVLDQGDHYYVGQPDEPFLFTGEDNNAMKRIVSWATYDLAGQPYTIATTHFTWSTAGSYTPLQARDAQNMYKGLDGLGEFVLCGDFNSPRQGEPNNVFNQLAAKYHDNIPAQYTTSVDPTLHKAGPLQLMVDGLFSTPAYRLSAVRLQPGVSDHQAIVAQVSRE